MKENEYLSTYDQKGQINGKIRFSELKRLSIDGNSDAASEQFEVATGTGDNYARLSPQTTKDRTQALKWLDNLLHHGSVENPSGGVQVW